jgi:hypothetical protein
MVNWTKTWQMIFNPLKCYVLKITKKKKTVDFDYNINGQTLETVASNVLLGVGPSQSVEYVFGDEGPKRCWHTQGEVGQAQCMLVSLPPH